MGNVVYLALKIKSDRKLSDLFKILDMMPIIGGDVDRDTIEYHSTYVYFEIAYDEENHDRVMQFLKDMDVESDEEEMKDWGC